MTAPNVKEQIPIYNRKQVESMIEGMTMEELQSQPTLYKLAIMRALVADGKFVNNDFK